MMVGDPHAVNPSPRLRWHALLSHWPVHDYSRRHAATLAAFGTAAGSISAFTVYRLHRRSVI
jgi:hypothetical protein